MAKKRSAPQDQKPKPAPAAAKKDNKGKGKGKAPAAKQQQQQPASKRARFEGPVVPASAKKALTKAHKKSQPTPKEAPTPAAPTTFVVSAGSYERFLYGLSCTFIPSTSEASGLPFELDISPIFAFPAHLSSLRSVAASLLPSAGTGSERKVGGKYLVSGGMDEVVKVWDLKRKKEVGTLDGDAAGSSFPSPTFNQRRR